MGIPSFAGLYWEAIPAAQYLYREAARAGLRPRITSVRRTYQQQAVLWERFIRGQSFLPAAPPGNSFHEFGRAFDMVTDSPEAVGDLWRRMGGQWFPSDPVHFQF